MKSLYDKLFKLLKHLDAINITFLDKNNFSNISDYNLYKNNYEKFEHLATQTGIKYSNIRITTGGKSEKVELSFADEIYHQDGRQMKLADLIEYLFFARGIYFIFQSNIFKKDRICIFLELILRFVNLLIIFECVTVDTKLRNALLNNLKNIIGNDIGFNDLKNWNNPVGLPSQSSNAPNEFFDSILPKTAGGLWHEMLVYAFILKYNIGYIFPLLLTQKPISLENKLSPPDLILLHNKTFRYYGIEIGILKERQSGGFMAPSGIPVIPIDTLNNRISDRCPSCNKWIGICERVINKFSDTNSSNQEVENEIRCLVDCNIYNLEDKLNGLCHFIKFKTKSLINGKKFSFADNKHHHYICCIKNNREIIRQIKLDSKYKDLEKINMYLNRNDLSLDEKKWFNENYLKLRKKFNYLKTHSVYYSELTTLINMNNA